MTPPARRVLVTGGATNIGRAVTECFLRQGARVAVAQCHSARAAREMAERHIGKVVPLSFDQGRGEDCRRLIGETVDRLGGLDVLVNNAAVTGPGAGRSFLDLDDGFVDRIIDVNLKGVIHLSVAAAKVMRDQGQGGVIIHISSVVAFRPLQDTSAYSAAKAGLSNLAQSMAKELGGFGIRVLTIAPGDIWTDTFEEVKKERLASGVVQQSIGQPVLGQGQPADIGEVVAFLASPGARYVTGTTVVVDGGLLA